MSWTPTDAQVRNLAIFLWRRWNPNGPTWAQTNQASRDEAMEEARAVLVAVGPGIAEKAWEEGQKSGARWGGPPLDAYESDPPSSNPYIEKEAGR